MVTTAVMDFVEGVGREGWRVAIGMRSLAMEAIAAKLRCYDGGQAAVFMAERNPGEGLRGQRIGWE